VNRLRRGAWPLACLLLVVASALVGWAASRPGLPPEALAWHRADWPGAPWTLWSGPLLHLAGAARAGQHAGAGRAGGAGRGAGRRGHAMRWRCCWPGRSARWGCAAGPGGRYWGLSGTMHAAAAVLALRALASPERRWLGLLLGGGLAIKLALERGWQVPIGFDTGWGFNVVFAAHLSGAIAGALLALGLNTLASMRAPHPHRS
jgi:hypothetical protein